MMGRNSRKKEVDMLSGSIGRGLLSVSIPILIMNVSQSLFSIIDLTVLKIFDLTGTAVGAVGVCASLIALITGLLIRVSTGANVTVAKYIGADNKEGVERAVGTSIAFALVGGAALAVIGICCAEIFLKWTNCPDELLNGAAMYFQMYFAGAPLLLIYNFCAAILRSAGDTNRPMIFLIVGGIIKLLSNYICVAYLNLGVIGVALSTLLSWSISALLCIFILIKNSGIVKLKPRCIRFYKNELRGILLIGIPSGIQEGIATAANVIIASAVNSFGADAATGISIANNFDGILYQICMAPSFAVMSYVSQNIGAGNVERAAKSVRKGIMITVLLGGIFGSLSAFFSGELSSLMTDSPSVIAFSQQKMRIISSTYFLCAINETFAAALRGMNHPTAPTVASLIFMGMVRALWVYLVFPLIPNMTFLYLVWPISWVMSIIMLLYYYRTALNDLREKACENHFITQKECL